MLLQPPLSWAAAPLEHRLHPDSSVLGREKDDDERRKEDKILEAAEAKKQAARAAARAKQRREERIKAAAAAEARKLKEAKEREMLREMRTGKAETSKLTSGPHSIHAGARVGVWLRHFAVPSSGKSQSGEQGEREPPHHNGVAANAKEALHLKVDEARDKTIVVPAKDLGLHSRGDADDGSMTMVAASMLCICLSPPLLPPSSPDLFPPPSSPYSSQMMMLLCLPPTPSSSLPFLLLLPHSLGLVCECVF